jgi:dTDP-4-dehydrorhamnose 3,5-epimerase
MNCIETKIPGVLIFEPKLFKDERGFFFESYNIQALRHFGIEENFVQDNHSRSHHNVLRGLHYQVDQPQGKLVRVVQGAIFDVAVDLRQDSPTFGQWTGVELSAENQRIFWLPAGMAHGFVTLSESADVLYKATNYYAPACERTIFWSDPAVGIEWPFKGEPILSAKDAQGQLFHHAPTYTPGTIQAVSNV